MKIIDRYLGLNVLLATLLVLAVLLGVELFFTLVEELGDVGKGTYGVFDALAYVLLTLPRRAYELLPVSALLGAVAALGLLASHGELVVLRAAGRSILNIGLGVLKTGLLIALGGMLMGEFVAPGAEQYAQAQRSMAKTNRATLQTAEGFWAKDGSTFIHIQDILPGAVLAGVTIYEFDDTQQLRVATLARRAAFRDGHWVLEGLEQSVLENERVRTRSVEQAGWETLLNPELLSVAIVKPENLSAYGLHRYIAYLEDNDLDAGRYRLAFWQRLAKPLAIAVMVLLAVPFTFGPLRSAHTGSRLVVGAVAGFAFYLFNLTAGQLSLVYGAPPLFGAFVPSLVFLAAALVLARRNA